MWTKKIPNGKIKCIQAYQDPISGKQKTVSLTIEKDTKAACNKAQQQLNDKIMEKVEQLINPCSNVTLQQLVTAYLNYQRIEVKQSTYTRNKSACSSFLNVLGADSLVNRYTAPYIRQCFMATRKSNTGLNEWRKRLVALLRWGYKNDYIDNINMVDKLPAFKDESAKNKVAHKYLESTELQLLLANLSVPIWKLLTEFLALTGLRVGEAIALNDSDVDLEKK